MLRVEKANLTLSRASRRLTSIKEENLEGCEGRSKNRELHETRTKRWPSPRFVEGETNARCNVLSNFAKRNIFL